jgi:hypothetical protein
MRLAFFVAIVLALVAFAGRARAADTERSQSSPARDAATEPATEVNRPAQVALIVGGLGVSALGYGAAHAYSADFPDHMEAERKRMRVPFVGPMLWAGHGIVHMCDRDADGTKMMFCGGGGYVIVGILALMAGRWRSWTPPRRSVESRRRRSG